MRTLLTGKWVLVHLAAVVLIVGFLGLCWWQVGRAASGNALSFGYAIEWPAFAGFVSYVWIKEARRAVREHRAGGGAARPTEAPSLDSGDSQAVAEKIAGAHGREVTDPDVRTGPRRRRNEAAYDDRDDPELAAYNHYLAWLSAHPAANPADYPGMKDTTTA